MVKKSIDKEEAELFRRSVGDVRPVKQDKHRSQQKKKTSIQARHSKKPFPPSDWASYLDPNDWLDAEDSVHFAKSGLQHKVIQRLKQGRIPIEATIDLHRQTIDEAVESITHFINDCLMQNKRWISIIHGKGHFSAEGKPILKNFLNRWLRDHPDVLAFHSAPPQRGGTGALTVLLKRRHHEK